MPVQEWGGRRQCCPCRPRHSSHSPKVAGMSMSQPDHQGQESPGVWPLLALSLLYPKTVKQCRLPQGAGPGCVSSPAPVAWQIPQTLSRPLPGCWHKSKDKFQNTGPPASGDSICLWLPESRHQGTTCCPLGCLAMVAAAWHYQPGAQGKQQRDEDREGAKSSARLRTRKRDQAQWRSNGLCWQGPGCRVMELTHGSTTCLLGTLNRLLNFSSSTE